MASTAGSWVRGLVQRRHRRRRCIGRAQRRAGEWEEEGDEGMVYLLSFFLREPRALCWWWFWFWFWFWGCCAAARARAIAWPSAALTCAAPGPSAAYIECVVRGSCWNAAKACGPAGPTGKKPERGDEGGEE